LHYKISTQGYGSSRGASDSPCADLAPCIRGQRAYEERGKNEPIEHAEASHYPLLSANVPARRKLHRERNFRIVGAMDRKTSPTIAVGAAVLEFRTEFDYLSEVLIAVLILCEA